MSLIQWVSEYPTCPVFKWFKTVHLFIKRNKILKENNNYYNYCPPPPVMCVITFHYF